MEINAESKAIRKNGISNRHSFDKQLSKAQNKPT